MRLFLYLGIAASAQAPMHAAIDASDLLANSPFVHAKIVSGATGTGETQPYLFRGICKIGEDLLINISDTAKKKNYWIKIGDTEGDIKVVSYDGESRKVAIVVGARDYTLDMAKPKTQTVAKNQSDKPDASTPTANSKDNPIRRIRRVRRSEGIPPPPFMNGDFRRDRMPQNVPPPPWNNQGDDQSGNRNASAFRTINEANSSSSSSGDNSSSSDSTPTSTPPGIPPNYVPTIPDSVRSMMEAGSAPSSPTNQ